MEIIKILLAYLISKTSPVRVHTRLCRLVYNYNSQRNKGIDCIIKYQPIPKLNSQKILINTKEFVGWNILFLKQYEKDTNYLIADRVKEGFHIVEAGAQIGSETLLLAALAGPSGKVYAFEPNPIVMKRLKVNIIINDLTDRVELYDMALGERNEEISFYIKSEEIPNQGMSSKYRFEEGLIEIKATQQTLDSWMKDKDIPRIDFLKMDVQGAEMDILNGASESILKFKPLIFSEADENIQADARYSMLDLFIKLSDFNYKVYLILQNGKLQKINQTKLISGNWLAIPEPQGT